MLVLLTRETCEVHRCDCIKWHDMNATLCVDWFMHSDNIKVITSTI
jgi:hypothetical protein